MKNILCSLILFSSLANAQATFHLAGATSTKAKVMVDGGGGYAYKNFLIEGSIIAPPLDNNMDHPAYFAANAGYAIKIGDVWSVTPLAGAAYSMMSTDKKELNGFVPSAGMRIQLGDVYLGCAYMDKTTILSIGISGVID